MHAGEVGNRLDVVGRLDEGDGERTAGLVPAWVFGNDEVAVETGAESADVGPARGLCVEAES